MTPNDARRVCFECGITGHFKKIAATLRPCLQLEVAVAVESTRKVGGHRLGGEPDLPANTPWPERNGKPMAFLAQIDLAQLPKAEVSAALPDDGLLSFFYDADEMPWGFDPKHCGAWKVVYSESGPFLPEEFPADLAVKSRFSACSIELTEDFLPEIYAAGMGDLLGDKFDTYIDTVSRYIPWGGHSSHLLGVPIEIQGPMGEECALVAGSADFSGAAAARGLPGGDNEDVDWRLLFQLGSEDKANMMWGDLGSLYFWIKESHLKAKYFDEVWLILQCS